MPIKEASHWVWVLWPQRLAHLQNISHGLPACYVSLSLTLLVGILSLYTTGPDLSCASLYWPHANKWSMEAVGFIYRKSWILTLWQQFSEELRKVVSVPYQDHPFLWDSWRAVLPSRVGSPVFLSAQQVAWNRFHSLALTLTWPDVPLIPYSTGHTELGKDSRGLWMLNESFWFALDLAKREGTRHQGS